jgi:hypothetical protein
MRWANLVIAVLFFAVLLAPTADKVFEIDRTRRPKENRAMAAKPEAPTSLDETVGYPALFEKWFDDHFGYRNFFVHAYHSYSKKLFGITRESKAIEGKDGWLFYTGDRLLDYNLGRRPFTTAQLDEWINRFVEAKRHVEAQGGRFLLVFAPNKHTIYSEFLPKWFKNTDKRPTRLDLLAERLGSSEKLPFIDLRGAIADAAAGDELVFHKTDTHWNDFGAFIAAREIFTELKKWWPAVVEPRREDFDFKTFDFEGDLGQFIYDGETVVERSTKLIPKSPRVFTTHSEDYYKEVEPTFKDTVITQAERAAIPKVVVFRDSFSNALSPFLSDNFGRAVYLWTYIYEPEVIEREKPDLVLHIMVERNI